MKLPNRLPPSPSRSRAGYLDYAEWPDRVRFIELGRLLQLYAQERHQFRRSGVFARCRLRRYEVERTADCLILCRDYQRIGRYARARLGEPVPVIKTR